MSSVLTKASGGAVTISADALKRSEQFMQQSGPPVQVGAAASSLPATSMASSTTGGRVSSVLTKASGGAVTISADALKRSEQFMQQSGPPVQVGAAASFAACNKHGEQYYGRARVICVDEGEWRCGDDIR